MPFGDSENLARLLPAEFRHLVNFEAKGIGLQRQVRNRLAYVMKRGSSLHSLMLKFQGGDAERDDRSVFLSRI